jgi:hypothetical protein
LGLFFAAGSLISLTAGASLLFPGGPLEPMWRLNPSARDGFGRLGGWSAALMAAVCLACALSAFGLLRGATWGRWVALCVLGLNLLGDATHATLGHDFRAAIGIPVAGALLAYLLSPRVVRYFAGPP